MANSITSNPIVLDTFTSDIDLGSSLFNNTKATFFIKHIEWQVPTTAAHTAVVTDTDGVDIFRETCTANNQSILKDFDHFVKGIKIASGGVSSGKISILLS